MKRVPGRKTDVRDAQWLAQLAECGLLRGSFIPPQPIRELRDLTRYRSKQVQERTREIQRMTKVLEDAQIKLNSVVTDPMGKSARLMMRALIAGERDPEVMADLALGRLRPKLEDLAKALDGRFNDHHALLLELILDNIERLEKVIDRLDAEVNKAIRPFSEARARLTTIPGVGHRSAEVIIAEIGVDMSKFPTPAALASWAGMCPGHHESAGKRSSGRTRHGSVYLRTALVECAHAAARTHTSLGAQYSRVAGRRRGHGRGQVDPGAGKRAAVAVGHSILRIAWHLLKNNENYQELGYDHLARPYDPNTRITYHLRQLHNLGIDINLDNAA